MKILGYYLITINIITFITYAADKAAAKAGKRRIRVRTLLLLAAGGGSLGALLAMYTFHHKTRVKYFTIGIPLMMALQAAAILYAMNVIF